MMIYEEAFAEDSRNCRSGGSGSRVDFERKFRLVCCNKQIYNEALPLLYKTHIFQFKVWNSRRACFVGIYNLGGIYSRFKEAPQDMLAMITDMHICLDEACVEEDASSGNTVTIRFFKHINRACTDLRSLHIKTQGLARPMCMIRMDYQYRYESPPYRRAMVRVFRALARRLSCLEFQVTDHIVAFEDFLSEVTPLDYWDKKSTPESKGRRCTIPGDQIYKIRGISVSELIDDTKSDETLTHNNESNTESKENTIDGEGSIISSDAEDSNEDVRGPSAKDEEDLEAKVDTYHTGNEDSSSPCKQIPAAPRGNNYRFPKDPARTLDAMMINSFSLWASDYL